MRELEMLEKRLCSPTVQNNPAKKARYECQVELIEKELFPEEDNNDNENS